MKFTSEFSQKNKILFGLIALILIASTFPVFLHNDVKENIIGKVIIVSINFFSIGLLFWIVSKTNYTIHHNKLICKSGPFQKKIAIEQIKRIENHSGIIVPALWKLALSHNGIIIYYGQFDEIYISPKESKKFIDELIKLNPNILLPTNA